MDALRYFRLTGRNILVDKCEGVLYDVSPLMAFTRAVVAVLVPEINICVEL